MATKEKPKLRKHHSGELRGLDGVSRPIVKAVFVTSPSDALKFLRAGKKAVTAAGDNGALNVWKDDAGRWRCEFMRYMATQGHGDFGTLAAAYEWLKSWWKKMER